VTIYSADFSSQPSGTPALSLSNGLGFYDVRVSGIADGTANICINNVHVDASTILQYYSGGSWVTATGIVATPGVEVCGNVPVSALQGTPLGGGDPPAAPEFPMGLPLAFVAVVALFLFVRTRWGVSGGKAGLSSAGPHGLQRKPLVAAF